jgi:hypothetical protein
MNITSLPRWGRNLLTRRTIASVLVAMLVLGCMPLSSVASSSIPQPVISIQTVDATRAPPDTVHVFSWLMSQGSLAFGATLTRYENSPIDVYFGILIPGGRVYTWTRGISNGPVLREGLSPAVQRTTETQIDSATILGSNPIQGFADDARSPSGLYSIFMFMVPAGAGPGDLRNWTGGASSPLFLSY